MHEPLCTAKLFLVDSRRTTHTRLSEILKQFEACENGRGRADSPQIDIRGVELDDLHEKFVKPIMKYLDPGKRSSIFYKGKDGCLATILIINGEVITS